MYQKSPAQTSGRKFPKPLSLRQVWYTSCYWFEHSYCMGLRPAPAMSLLYREIVASFVPGFLLLLLLPFLLVPSFLPLFVLSCGLCFRTLSKPSQWCFGMFFPFWPFEFFTVVSVMGLISKHIQKCFRSALLIQSATVGRAPRSWCRKPESCRDKLLEYLAAINSTFCSLAFQAYHGRNCCFPLRTCLPLWSLVWIVEHISFATIVPQVYFWNWSSLLHHSSSLLKQSDYGDHSNHKSSMDRNHRLNDIILYMHKETSNLRRKEICTFMARFICFVCTIPFIRDRSPLQTCTIPYLSVARKKFRL